MPCDLIFILCLVLVGVVGGIAGVSILGMNKLDEDLEHYCENRCHHGNDCPNTQCTRKGDRSNVADTN